MYSGCGVVEAADQVLIEMSERNIIAWNRVIFSYVRSGGFERGLQLLIAGFLGIR